MRSISTVLIITVALALGACSGWGEKPDITKGWSAQRLYNAAKEKLGEGDYETAIDYYEKLESRYPFGAYAEQSQLEIAYAYYKYDEPVSAIAACDRFIKLHPQHPNVDYAYYLKGLTNFNRGKGFIDRLVLTDPSQRDPGAAEESFRDFSELTRRFPDSKYSPDATQRMLFLRNILAEHEIHVSEYYMRRGAYVAAVNRAKYVIENFQGTPSVPDALVLMAKGYKVMDLDDLSEDAVRVLRLNYPDHAGLAEVERLVVK